MKIIDEILAAAESITDEEMALAERELRSPDEGEALLGAVPPDAMRLWTLARRYEEQKQRAEVETKFAHSDEDKRRSDHMAHRADAFEDAARELAWIAARDERGEPAWTAESVGIRSGWMLVRAKSTSPSQALAKILAGLQP